MEEALVKEEFIDARDDHSGTIQYEDVTGNSSAGGQCSTNLMIPKYEESSKQDTIAQLTLGQPLPLHETFVEALAGPSGIQRVSSHIIQFLLFLAKVDKIKVHPQIQKRLV